jgi:hypothetical protein
MPSTTPMARHVSQSLQQTSKALGVCNPMPYLDGLISRTFYAPDDDLRYAQNRLSPGAVPYEVSFSETEPQALRMTIEPLGPEASPIARRDEATREMRRLIAPVFGREALRWFDTRSEAWRGFNGMGWMNYGAWFGSAFDEEGLYATKIYYELCSQQIDSLSPNLARLTREVMQISPNLTPIFTSIGCKKDSASQRVTFMHRGPLVLTDLTPLMAHLGLAHQLPSLMRTIGVALGGRFELPQGAVLIGMRETQSGIELKLEVLLGALPDLPRNFLNLLRLGLSERPRQVQALERWLSAFGADNDPESDGHFSVLSVRVSPKASARISLYVRPIEFEMRDSLVAA